MTGHLIQARIDYVMMHLDHHSQMPGAVSEKLVFLKDVSKIDSMSGKIIFLLSERGLEPEKIFRLEDLPVLFPVRNPSSFYTFENGDLVFEHDLLKSAFYLLSGCQETLTGERDRLGRFPYALSIQNELGITGRPVVNYYFDIILRGIREFAEKTGIDFKPRSIFQDPMFVLSHDVDRVDKYDCNYLGYKIKEFLGLSRSGLKKGLVFRQMLTGMIQYLNVINRKNPYWNFKWLRDLEENHGLRSVFYFLGRDQKHTDAYYDFSESRIKKLIDELSSDNCEIGLHGTVRSTTDYDQMKEQLKKLESVTGNRVEGIRQHRLIFEHPVTSVIQEKAEFRYDTTLGFAEHEGFRNSYCHPFRLYHFKEERVINLWEIPLNVMDCTLMEYRDLSFEAGFRAVDELLSEVCKFNGVFTLLWHNAYFDEMQFPGIKEFYRQLLNNIHARIPRNMLPGEIAGYFHSAGTRTT